jgi:predicted signal transduction protein with EAL and GGDEF domain
VLSEGLASEASAARIAGQLMSALAEPVELAGAEQVVSASIGASFSRGESSATELLRDADAAMYQAKTAGRNRFEIFDTEMRDRILARVRTESALRAALANEHEIHVHYQPLVSLRTGRIIGAEALARWRHPDWGPVSTLEFIPVAEESGLIHQLGAEVIRQATRDSAAWQHVPDFAGIAVNISTRQLVQPDEVARLIRGAVATTSILPGFLTLEITESVLIEQFDSARAALKALNDIGVQLSLDDFGTGYSSLSYLSELPLHSVKIDRSLTRNIDDTPHAAALAAAIIDMGHALGLQVIAEGIETPQQAAQLRTLGCDTGQGFLFARPMAPEPFTALLHTPPTWQP